MDNSGNNNPMSNVHRYGKNSPNYKKGKPKCDTCGKQLKYYSTNKCKTCYLKSLSGKNNGNWKGGVTKIISLIRNNKKTSYWRNKIFKRDNYTCQICKQKSCGNIEVHHKIPLNNIIKLFNIKTLKQALKCKLLWDINWGITLCKKCHTKIPKKG
jgi:5-methylcytosine-specific restriction endonuclease McrA